MKVSAVIARVLALSMLVAVCGPVIAQQAYPGRPIRLIVPYPPGGGTTVMARLMGQKLIESWGQQVIVDNRPGGDTIIGTEAFVKSPADGYTILLAASAHVIVPLLHRDVPFDALKDVAAVAALASTEQLLVLHPSVPANTLQEFIALARSKPGQLNFASAGTGNTNHLANELFNMIAGIKMQHIPYKGSGPAVIDLVGGQLQSSFHAIIAVLSHVKSGKLKALAVSGERRSAALPQVPTFTEAGLPGVEARVWYGILAPAGTPKEIINKLSTEIARIIPTPDYRERVAGVGMEPFAAAPEQFAALMRADMARYAKVIKTANIKIEH